MTPEQIIDRFYSSFASKNADGMNALYSEDVVFSDPVFGLLEGEEVKSMWEMLCKNAEDFQLTYGNITAVDDEYFTCNWQASYMFSKTGKKVVNKVKAFMRIKDGKIVEHSDGFRFTIWASQAFGWKGQFFSWTNFFKRKVQKTALKNLAQFMEQKKERN